MRTNEIIKNGENDPKEKVANLISIIQKEFSVFLSQAVEEGSSPHQTIEKATVFPNVFQHVLALDIQPALQMALTTTVNKLNLLVDYTTPNSPKTLDTIFYTLKKYFSPAQNRSEESCEDIEKQRKEFQEIILDRFKQNPQFIIYSLSDDDSVAIFAIGFRLYSIFLIDPDFAKEILKLIEIVFVDEAQDNGESTPILEKVRSSANNDLLIDHFIKEMNKQEKAEFLQFVKDFKNKITVVTPEQYEE